LDISLILLYYRTMPILRESSGLLSEENDLSPQYPLKVFSKPESGGEVIRLHYHSSFELNLFHSAAGVVRFENSHHSLDKEKLILIPPRCLHAYRIAPRKNARVTVVHFALPSLTAYINPERIEQELKALPRSLEKRILEPLISGYSPGLYGAYAALELLFAILTRIPNEERSVTSPAEGRLLRLVSFVDEHYAEEISLEQAARIAGCSKSTLTRLFREQTGAGFHAFLTSVRIEHASRLLRRGVPATETALACGFYDASHFVRIFKAHTGTTPAKYGKAENSRRIPR